MTKMTAEITAISTMKKEEIAKVTAKELELFGGHSANICYTERNWHQVLEEPLKTTENRIAFNKANHHHSVFGHGYISVYFDNIPKALAMLLNNEHEYNTSEKSARYTKMKPSERELQLYEKWLHIFEREILARYPNERFLKESKIKKLAQENARYMISIMTPTKMEYTTSHRQWNYLYDFAGKMLEKETSNRLIQLLKPSLEEFREVIRNLGILSFDVCDYRNREFSLIVDDNSYEEYFGRCYSVNYMASVAEVAQAQRHRTIDYNVFVPDVPSYVMPPIISGNRKLEKEWLDDLHSVENLFPQGTMLQVNETGTYENFILKLQERLCSCAQLEICEQSKKTLMMYIWALEKSSLKSNRKILEELQVYAKGARCLAGYDCKEPCHFKEGIQLTRKI